MIVLGELQGSVRTVELRHRLDSHGSDGVGSHVAVVIVNNRLASLTNKVVVCQDWNRQEHVELKH